MSNLLTSIAADSNTLIVTGAVVLVTLLGYLALIVAGYIKHNRRQ